MTTSTTSGKPGSPAKPLKPALDLSTLTTDHVRLGKEIDKARVSAAKVLDVEFQRLALSAIKAVQDHGNVFYVNEVFKALPKGARHAAMTEWLLAFGGVCPNPDKGRAKDMPFAFAKGQPVLLEKAASQPWVTFAPSKPVEAYDVMAQLQRLLKTVDAGKREVRAPEGALDALRALVQDYAEEAPAETTEAAPEGSLATPSALTA